MTHRFTRPGRGSTVVGFLVAATVAVAGITGCTGSNGSSSSTASKPRAAAAAPGAGSGAGAAGAGGVAVAGPDAVAAAPAARPAAADSVAQDVAAAQRDRILTATVTEKVPDVGQAVAIASGAAVGAGGYLGSATTTAASGPGTGASADLVLRVPNDRFDSVLASVSAPNVGKVTSSQQTASDVTGQVADLSSRLATQRASIARVRVLFARATSVGQVVALESALTDRESTLESLLAQQRALSGQVDDATISLTLLGPGVVVKTVRHPVRHAGFVSGLRGGWHALGRIGRAIAVVTGALLPFAPVIAVLLALGWWLARRQRRHDPPTRLPAPTPPAG